MMKNQLFSIFFVFLIVMNHVSC